MTREPPKKANPLVTLVQRLQYALTRKFLCDSCKYNYGNACIRPERPNAIICPDHKKRGS